ncbi:hypothetical protein SS50377_24809 [Spironucleus salmonicida]|uniref:Uncharacterized protein n=1 Tax=Spironucleus salmonicida TaxID=348837 RepID=V6LHU6_9EUKA|nr:hypothetical protein SS50377_24809 [Spironucleus salmonicida]|eukprot:EST44127.1 Hypothetical protein SS50377_16085 [Spironucleus salmonicida]
MSLQIFHEITNLPVQSKFEMMIFLNDIYDILDCSISDFLFSFDTNQEQLPTPKNRLNDPFSHICGDDQFNVQTFTFKLSKFAQIIKLREIEIYGSSGDNILISLNKLEMHNNELPDLAFLANTAALIGAKCNSISDLCNSYNTLLPLINQASSFFQTTPIVFLQSIFSQTFSLQKANFSMKSGPAITFLVDVSQQNLQIQAKSAQFLLQILLEIQTFSGEICRKMDRRSLLHWAIEMCLERADQERLELPLAIADALRQVTFEEQLAGDMEMFRDEIECSKAIGGIIQFQGFDSCQMFNFCVQKFKEKFLTDDLELSDEIHDDWKI